MEKMNEYYDADIAEKYVIYIPKEKNCIYLAGYKIEGFDSLESFGEHLKKLHDVEKELKHYKDLEEQGRLLVLPCKVGDTIYKIPSKINHNMNRLYGLAELNKVCERIVYSVELRYLVRTCDGTDGVESEFYEKTWFTTKAEAEKTLAEMEK